MIVLLTDFGLWDPYVGIMKGVIQKICPGTQIIDLCHNLPPQGINTGSFYLQYSYYHFPDKTIFCAVIDPGVGGSRKALIVETEKYYFIGPDNGLFGFLIHNQEENRIINIIHLDNPDYYYKKSPDNTFHGRDIFASAAAYIEKGTPTIKMGTKIDSIINCTPFTAFVEHNRLCVPLIHIDHFGNLIFSLTPVELANFIGTKPFTIHYKNLKINTLSTNYEFQEEFICLFNSYGLLEIALNSNNAAAATNSVINKEEKLYIYHIE